MHIRTVADLAARRGFQVVSALALAAGLAILALLPHDSSGAGLVDKTTSGLNTSIQRVLTTTTQVSKAVSKPAAKTSSGSVATRAISPDPATQPPLYGTNPHGQGTVAAVDLNPNADRPFAGDPTGEANGEEIVVGRSRGEQNANGTYHGHITIAALLGNEILGVDTGPGETKAGPLDALQTQVLDAICDGSGDQICLSVLRADSSTTPTGSTNHFSAAHATLGGADSGLDVGVAESDGNIASDGTCQTSVGHSRVANVNAAGSALASVSDATTTSKACRDQSPQQTNTSSVIGLGGSGVPLPAPGCADGTPDTVTGIPTVLPIVCNSDDLGQAPAPAGAREALAVYGLYSGSTSLLKALTAGADSHAVAPAAAGPGGETQCSDGVDNDGDGQVDLQDPECQSPNDDSESQCSDGRDNDHDGKVDLADPDCDNANDDDESGPGGGVRGGRESNRPECSDNADNDGDGLVDSRDPGCHSDGNANNPASYNPNDDSEFNGAGGRAQCSDGADNDGDGKVDSRDPGCHSDGNANNAASYNPNDDSEADTGALARASNKKLAFTGTDVLGIAIAGLLTLGAGVALRRRLASD